MPWGWVSAAGSLLGGIMGSGAASDAAAAQQAAADKATAEQRRQYDLNRADQAPFMNTGRAANSVLARKLGLGGTPGGGQSADARASLRSSLLPQFTTTSGGGPIYGPNDNYESGEGWANGIHIPREYAPGASTVDEAGLQTAMGAAGNGIDSNASDYGDLLRKFSAADMQADPVHQAGLKFGLDQGTGAINQRAIAGGGYDSGATLKALTKYANDYGSTKANESYNRYNTDQNSVYNKLAGVSGAGQQATNQVGTTGTAISGNISNLDTQAGNARSAGIMGGANAWSGALTGVGQTANTYAARNWLEKMKGGGYPGQSGDYRGMSPFDYAQYGIPP